MPELPYLGAPAELPASPPEDGPNEIRRDHRLARPARGQLKEEGIYRKLAAMLAPLPGLMAAVLVSPLALGSGVVVPPSGLVESIVVRMVGETATALAARRGVRLVRPVAVSLVDRAQMAEASAGASAADDAGGKAVAGSSTGRGPATSPSVWRQVVFDHLGLSTAAGGRGTTAAGAPPAPLDVAGDVTGMFDVRQGRLLLASWADFAAGRFAWTRDLAQAVLDRRFSLGRWMNAPASSSSSSRLPRSHDAADAGTSDALLARQATVHGDATVQALENIDPQLGLPAPRNLSVIAADVRRTLTDAASAETSWAELHRRLFVELDGLMFVAHFRARLPWREVDELWRRPAASSEQVLHPEKYEREEQPDPVGQRLPPSTAKDPWRVVHGDTLGEWGVRTFLERGGDAYRAQRASTGWGGDRLLLLRDAEHADTTGDRAGGGDLAALKTETFVVWITTWDDETDAVDFAAEAARALAGLAGVTLLDDRPASGRVQLTAASGRLFAVERRRRAVGLLLAAPRAAAEVVARFTAAAATAAPRPARRPAARQGATAAPSRRR